MMSVCCLVEFLTFRRPFPATLLTAFGGDHVMKTYDLVIIGSGTAAQVAGSRVRAAGWSVALVDHRPFGGTCAPTRRRVCAGMASRARRVLIGVT
jgi:hypothetical protein